MNIQSTCLLLLSIFFCSISAQDLDARLFDAIEKKHFWKVRRLLDRGASVCASQSPHGITPLIAAVRSACRPVISTILRAGAPLAQTDTSGKNVLHHAVLLRAFSLASSFIKPSIIDAQDAAGCTPLHVAVKRGYSFFVNILLRHHAHPNIADRKGKKPIDYALAASNCAIVSLLLKHGVHITPAAATHFLKTAVCSNRVKLIEQLVERGADVRQIGECGQTLLHYAANASSQTIKLLLTYDIPLNHSNSIGCTPLHIAAGASNKDFVELLLEAGAEVNCVTINKATPLMLAKDPQIMCLLLEKGANIDALNDEGKTVVMDASGENLDLLLLYGPSLEIKDLEGLTALMQAAKRNDAQAVRSLVKAGARVDARLESTTQTALHFVHSHREDVAHVLIEAGADYRALDKDLNIAGQGFEAVADTVVQKALLNTALLHAHDGDRPSIIEAGILPGDFYHHERSMRSAWFDVNSYEGLLRSFHERHLYDEGAAFTNPHTRRPLHRLPYPITNVHAHLLHIFECEQLSVDCMYDRYLQDAITMEPFLVRKGEARSLVRDWLKSENKYSKLRALHILDQARTQGNCYSMPKLLEQTKTELGQ